MVQTINRDELRQKIERGDRFLLLDVLAPEYYERAHLPGALNVPWEHNEAAFLHQAGHVIPSKGAEVVVYCAKPT